MLYRALRHSRLAPSLRAPSLGQRHGQIACLHSTPSVSATKDVDQTPAGSLLANGWRKKTVAELKLELKRRGLPVTGKKEELVRRLTNANANFGIVESLGASSSVSPTEATTEEQMTPSLRISRISTFTTPFKAPLVPKTPDSYATPTVAPILKVNTQALSTSIPNLRIGTMPSAPMSPTLPNKGSFANLRAASTLTPPKPLSSSNISPKTSRNNLGRQSTTSNTSSPAVCHNPSTNQSQLRHASTISPTSILTTKASPKSQSSYFALSFSPEIAQSPSKRRHLHNSKPVKSMLSDNVYLPTFTDEVPIEIPRVPILPTTQRAPPPIEIETQPTEPLIITAAGAYTHPTPPGRGSDQTKEHLQSDMSKRRPIEKESEKQDGKFEGDWHGDSESSGDTFKFVPETGEIPASDKGILWGIVGAATLWGVFGPEKKNRRK